MDKERDDFYKEIGKRIREIREMWGITQSDLAEMVNASRPSVVHIEAGKQRVTVLKLCEIAEAISIEVSELIPGEILKGGGDE